MLTCGGLFDGIGLLAYGLHRAGLEHRWLCERDEWRRSILAKRWPGVPVFDDVRTVGAGTAEPVHVIAGGFPCKGVSAAGKRQGFGHPETVLWREMARAVRELRPRYVLVENVADLLRLHDGELFAEVLGDLATCGFDAVWDVLPAGAVGAPHLRERVFVIASHPDGGAVEPGRLRRGEREADQGAATDPESLGTTHARRDCGERREQGPVAAGGRGPASNADGENSERHAGQRGRQDGRADARGSDSNAPNAMREGLEGRGLQGPVADGGREAAADPECERGAGRREASDMAGSGGRAEGEARQRQRGGDAADDRGATAPDASGGRQPREPQRDSGTEPGLDVQAWEDAQRRGIRVEWAEYEGAIRRWERVLGRPAPEPLLRRVDARHARRVERSRLSALGDGVQVQIGEIAGAYIIERERGRLAA